MEEPSAVQTVRGVLREAIPIPATWAAAAPVAEPSTGAGGAGVAEGPEVAVPTEATTLRQVVPPIVVLLKPMVAVRQVEEVAKAASGARPPVAEGQADAVPKDGLAVRVTGARRLEVVAAGHAATTTHEGP